MLRFELIGAFLPWRVVGRSVCLYNLILVYNRTLQSKKSTKIALISKFHSHFRAATRKLENKRIHPKSRFSQYVRPTPVTRQQMLGFFFKLGNFVG